MEELGHFQLPGIVYRFLQQHDNAWLCIIMLKHEVIAVGELHNEGLQDLITLSLCIQIAIDKIQLCSLSTAYACPYHNPTSAMGQSVHYFDISDAIHMVCGCEAGWTYC